MTYTQQGLSVNKPSSPAQVAQAQLKQFTVQVEDEDHASDSFPVRPPTPTRQLPCTPKLEDLEARLVHSPVAASGGTDRPPSPRCGRAGMLLGNACGACTLLP